MPNPLPFDYKQDTDGKVWAGRDGYFTLEIGRQQLVKKRLGEILPFVGGEEKSQIKLALQVIETNRLRKPDKKQELERLIKQWKKHREKLKIWVERFSAKCRKVERKHYPKEIWNRAYALTLQAKAIEIFQFKLIKASKRKAFLEATESFVDDSLRRRNGFVSFELARNRNGLWTSIIHWVSQEDAEQAAEESLDNSAYVEFKGFMDPSSVQHRIFRMRILRK